VELLTEQSKIHEIAKINSELSALNERASITNGEIEALIEKRDTLNKVFKKLQEQIRVLKKERESSNEKVQTLKRHRNATQVKIKTHIEAIKVTKQKIAELKKKKPRENQRVLQAEFDDIEWKIQTTPLNMQEEKEIMERVKKLETQLNVYKKIDQCYKEISKRHEELQVLEATANKTHHQLTDIAERSQKIHTKVIAKIQESNNVKDEADSMHSVYIQTRKQFKHLLDEIKRLIEQKRELQNDLKEEEEKKRKRLEHTLKEKLGAQARDKLQRGEKLNWEEFKLLVIEDSKDPQAQN
jgi:uncharacterized coiled-coil DUF342 family protein